VAINQLLGRSGRDASPSFDCYFRSAGLFERDSVGYAAQPTPELLGAWRNGCRCSKAGLPSIEQGNPLIYASVASSCSTSPMKFETRKHVRINLSWR
jgi:hypothetical protein